MKTVLLFILLLPLLSYSQDIAQIDSLSIKVCDRINQLDSISSSEEKIRISYKEIVLPHVINKSDSIKREVFQVLFLRMQRRCEIFLEITNELNGDSNSIKRVVEEPKSIITKKEIEEFKRLENFWYNQSNGMLNKVKLTQDEWISYHEDETISRYKLKWKNDEYFEIEYIESNNFRSKMNIKGDAYQYKILSKNDSSFKLCEWVKGMKKYTIFELNY